MLRLGFDMGFGIKERRIGYARVSMPDQNIRSQCGRLEEWQCHRVYADEGVSGSKAKRPALAEMLHYRMAGLNLMVAIIIFWNTKQLSHAVAARKCGGFDWSPELLSHISPLGLAHSCTRAIFHSPRKNASARNSRMHL